MRLATLVWIAALLFPLNAGAAELLNVSYDPTREFYDEYNAIFAKHWHEEGKGAITINQSHGGSGSQARAVIEGLKADVVTLALASDIDEIVKRSGLIDKNWQSRLPHNSAPYTSIVVFLVKKGNPKHIHDWNDLIRKDVLVITPNPKTSGGARWIYLAAWGWGEKQGDAVGYVRNLFRHVPVLDAGARGATTTFTKRGMGDVLLAWESEAELAVAKTHREFEIIVPSLSIRAEPPVAVVDKVVDKKNTRDVAEAYLKYLYSEPAQELAAKYHYRPVDENVLARHAREFPATTLLSIVDFGGWEKAQGKHFANGGTFEEVFEQ